MWRMAAYPWAMLDDNFAPPAAAGVAVVGSSYRHSYAPTWTSEILSDSFVNRKRMARRRRHRRR